VYVLISRTVDPRNILLVGVPPKDMIEDVAQALLSAGISVDAFFDKACTVTREWIYDKANHVRVKERIRQRISNEHGVPLKFRTLAEVLNPQPDASVVIKRLLDWIDRVDTTSQTGAPKPPFQTEEGQSIFPEDDDPWWLTDISRRAPVDEDDKADGDEDGPPSDIEEQQQEVSDDDPESEPDLVSPVSARAREPVVAWRQ
jgi:hypothetical protein